MFSTTGSRGLYMAPLSKGLLLVLNGLTVMLTLLPQYQEMFVYNLQAVTQQHQVWRLLCGRLICLDVKDSFCSSLLIYNFRIFERRFGTRKFASFLLGTWCLSALVDFVLAQTFQYVFEYEVKELPAGLLAPVFALFVPFYLSIPRMPVTQILGHIQITNKSLVYIVGLQVSFRALLLRGLYYSNVLWLQKILFVPAWVSYVGRYILEPLFSSSQPTDETPLGMGATLDIQRQQRMDLLDQQLLLAQYNEARRNARHQPQAGLLQWTRLFPSLRHRGQNRPPTQPHPQVARLVEMGFSRIDALEALRASNNDINMATNFLLQH
uniref:UBA domain containing 2 n=1 Tax=Kryptolebias marmoratus TaxID=37003 RepID=A0A3Q2ZR32_KRYMA